MGARTLNELQIALTVLNSDTSIKKLQAIRKEALGIGKDATIGSAEYFNSAKIVVDATNRMNEAMKKFESEAARMKRSYFELGEEIRRKTNPAMISMNQIIQDAPYGIRGMGNNIQFLTQQFTQLRAGGMSTTDILKGMMQNALTPIGALMLSVSVGTSLLTVAMDKFGGSAKKAHEEADTFLKSLKAINKEQGLSSEAFVVYSELLDAQKKLAELKNGITKLVPFYGASGQVRYENVTQFGSRGEIEEQQKKIHDLRAKVATSESDQLSYQLGKLRDMVELGDIGTKQQLETLRYYLAITTNADEQRKIRLEILSIEKEISGEKNKQDKLQSNYVEMIAYESQAQHDMATFMFGGTKEEQEAGSKIISPNDDKKSKALVRRKKFLMDMRNDNASDALKDTEKELRKAVTLYNSAFFDPIRAGFDAVISGASSFADAFVNGIKKMILQLVEFAVIAGIISLILGVNFLQLFGKISGITSVLPTETTPTTHNLNGGFINEPVVGFGRSGRRYTFAEDGKPEYVVSNRNIGNMSRNGGSNEMVVHVVGKYKGGDIYLANENHKQRRNVARLG